MARTRRAGAALPYGALDRDHLVKHLLELARRVGVENVTMRALATEAGTSASSVYYHVKDKAALLDLLAESVIESIEVPTEGDWEQRTRALYTNAWKVMIAIPGIAAMLQQRPLTGAADAVDRTVKAIMAESGWTADEVAAAHVVLYIHLLGSVQLEHHLRHSGIEIKSDDGAESVFQHGLRVILAGLRSCHTETSTPTT
ncbi:MULTISPECIES: TetR family transcriptional regulator [Mycolicibacterium]|uniref:Transcriptional regulator, TetR family n=2 Tax=Mycolicibacterium TaxID=1866885 RepID=A1TGE9_MYCVP|nr:MULTISPECIES: TetR family transcriptional regulator [Mycolicibacterium]ABM16249.1 transcriptional regulator, TetR family [Mycolicibacterium vanbaalenii PYR-1]MCV7126519.1 TetR family transcriptional regulator [Mycolicibacterium vanbaalenii PYR-1]MDN4519564.1 TetR family transcriptional regulator [Mycolicibacterium austroafricanum]MDW5614945.1 TetR family transcriptional regulator [Mycolicibacterium sp. D5.8-2]PQP43679.1 TetR family transcriptional regulator [Mycolicibacterium austroafricanu